LTRDLKRRVFPPALFAMLTAIATGAAGAAAQVEVWRWEIHATLATLTLLVNLWAFRIEYDCLRINLGVLDEVMREVTAYAARTGWPAMRMRWSRKHGSDRLRRSGSSWAYGTRSSGINWALG